VYDGGVKKDEQRKFVSTAHNPAKVRAEIGSAAPDRLLTAKILEAQDTERRKIGCELHDSVGGSLTVIKIGLGKLKSKLADAQRY